MPELIFPIIEIEKNKFRLAVDVSIYNKEVITTTVYKFSHLFYIYQSTNNDNSNIINVIFESKDKEDVKEETIKQFCNELIDQQVRYNTNKEFGYIRGMIVEEAFKPVTSK